MGTIDVGSALLGFLVFCIFFIIVVLLFCCFFGFLLYDKVFRTRRSGSHNVHENEVNELGEHHQDGLSLQHQRGIHTLPYVPEEREFHRAEEEDSSSSSSTAQCPICLEEFAEGEVIMALA